MNTDEINNVIRFANSGNIIYVTDGKSLIILKKSDCYHIDEQRCGTRKYIKTNNRYDVENILRDIKPIDILKTPPNLPKFGI